jgi:hypothetical protein
MELVANSFVKSKMNTKSLKILTMILLFVLLCGMNNTNIYYIGITPFGISIVFALLYIGFNGYLLGGLFFLSYLVTSVSVENLVIGMFIALILGIMH